METSDEPKLMTAHRQDQMTSQATSRKWLLILVWPLTAIAVLPLVFQWHVPPPRNITPLFIISLRYLLALGVCYWIYRVERKRLLRSQAMVVAYLVFALTTITNIVHHYFVDLNAIFPRTSNMSNLQWQVLIQQIVMQLRPDPYSYRFLPNCIVRWIELAGINFAAARDIYRLVFVLLLFYVMYRYARLYTNYIGGIVAMVMVAAVYPVSFEHYAGQLTDPLSHLSFLLAFISLETGAFAAFLTTLFIGSMAKETVLALAGYYVLFCRGNRNYGLKAAVLCVAVPLAYFGVRLPVQKGHMEYQQISGVSLDHVPSNWADNGIDPNGQTLFGITAGAFLPFLLLGWKDTPRSLRSMALFLLPVLFTSSLFFSWLHEARNYMPVVFVLAVVAARYLTGAEDKGELKARGQTALPIAERVVTRD